MSHADAAAIVGIIFEFRLKLFIRFALVCVKQDLPVSVRKSHVIKNRIILRRLIRNARIAARLAGARFVVIYGRTSGKKLNCQSDQYYKR